MTVIELISYILAHPWLIFADAFAVVFGVNLAIWLCRDTYEAAQHKIQDKSKKQQKIGF